MKNILFIMSDQHNSRCFSYKNHPDAITPNIDKLAEQGVHFENAYCNNPICTPSRMSYLSGKYASTHGYFGLYGIEPAAKITNMFSYFKESGYRTGALGKLHTPRYWVERDSDYTYDEFLEHPRYLDGVGLFDKNDNRNFYGNRDGECSHLPYEHSCEKVLVKNFKRFIDNEIEPSDRVVAKDPWFCWAAFARPHQPYTPSKEFYDLFDPEKLHVWPTAETESESYKMLQGKMSPERLRKEYHAYMALVAQVDFAIGEMVEMLRERGQLDNTIIVYCADHGDYAGAHGLMEKRNGISSVDITKVPFIIVDPQGGYKGMRKQVVQSIDLFPTLCELADLKIPNTVQGDSFLNLLKDENAEFVRDYALTENVYRKAIATEKYRYIANVVGKDELYNIQDDPHELCNLIDSEQEKDTVVMFQRKMIDALVHTMSPIITTEGFWYHEYNSDGRADMKGFDESDFYA